MVESDIDGISQDVPSESMIIFPPNYGDTILVTDEELKDPQGELVSGFGRETHFKDSDGKIKVVLNQKMAKIAKSSREVGDLQIEIIYIFT